MRWIGGTLIFLAEVAMISALVWLANALLGGALGWVAGLVIALAVALLWGTYLSPKARRPLAPAPTLAARTLLLLAGAIAFFAVGATTLAITQAAAVIVGTALMAIWPFEHPGPKAAPAQPAKP